MPLPVPLRVDIFCLVIDNFGDAGVCWRLARQLSAEHACSVRLWLDKPDVLAALLPQGLPASRHVEGVAILPWDAAQHATPADIVIEAFACDPPPAYVARMAAAVPRPVWINLEYLSAENWVEGSHGLPSIHPRLGLRKHFYFPGFTEATGGLLRERDLAANRRAFLADDAAIAAFWRARGIEPPAPGTMTVSLFTYENEGLPALLDAWAAGDRPILCVVPAGRVLASVSAWAGRALAAGQGVQQGCLRVEVLPFMSQAAYDRLLWACDLNFVRGEDSFVRAQWAARPFVWHIYPQDEAAHLIKLEAFLARFEAGLSPAAARALREFWMAWESQRDLTAAWPAFHEQLSAIKDHADAWARALASQDDLASGLLNFCAGLLE